MPEPPSTFVKIVVVLGLVAAGYYLYTQKESPSPSPSPSPSVTTPSSTESPTPSSAPNKGVAGIWEVYAKDGTTDNKFTMTFSDDTKVVSVPSSYVSQFPSNMTYSATSISGTVMNNGQSVPISLPISYDQDKNQILISAPNKSPLFLLKPTPAPTTRASTSPSPSTRASTSPSPSSATPTTPAPSKSVPTPYVPVIAPTDPPSTIKGRYIQIRRDSPCLAFGQIEVYSTPYGKNVMNMASVTSSSANKLGGLFELTADAVKNTDKKLGFMSSCFDKNYVLTTDDKSPWILIDLKSVMPIYKIVIHTGFNSVMAIGAVFTILDQTKKEVFKGNTLTDVAKGISTNIDSKSISTLLITPDIVDPLSQYGSFTFYPSLSTGWIGGPIDNLMKGVWTSLDGKNVVTLDDKNILLNILKGPVQSEPYKMYTSASGFTKLGVIAPTATPKPTIAKPLVPGQTPVPKFTNINYDTMFDMLKFNGKDYCPNRFVTETKWRNNGNEYTFNTDMTVTATIVGPTRGNVASATGLVGTYKVYGPPSDGTPTGKVTNTGTLNIGSGDVSISYSISSDRKKVVTIGNVAYIPNEISGSWVSIDLTKPVAWKFSDDMSCLINNVLYTYSDGVPSIQSDRDYLYTIKNSSGTPVYFATANRGIMDINETIDGSTVGNKVATLIKNAFPGTWSGKVEASGADVTWVIDDFFVNEQRKSGDILPIGSYWIHGPNTSGSMSATVTKSNTIYSLVYSESDDKSVVNVTVSSANGLIATLRRK